MHGNFGTDVIDMDSGTKLLHVVRIDPEACEVECAHIPVRERLGSDGELDTYKIGFRSVYPIYAGRFKPYFVHCYGRKA